MGPVLGVRPYVEPLPGDLAVENAQRPIEVIESRWVFGKDDVAFAIFCPSLLPGLAEKRVARDINGREH